MSDEAFNSPFSGLGKDLKGGKKKAASVPAPARSPGPEKSGRKSAPGELSQDFTAEDAEGAALFLAALGRPGELPGPLSAPDAEAAEAPKVRAKKAPAASARPAGLPDIPPDISPDIPLIGDEAQSFAEAMRGVRPVNGRGRALVPPAPPAPVRHKSAGRDYLAEFTEGKYEFALEYTEEFFEGRVMGLDPLVAAKLRAGQYSPEAHIDLHGLNSEQAYTALLAFIKSAYIHSRRHLVVVTGRGKNSPGGLSVLRQSMQEWLTREPLRRVVLAFCTAQPKDGGAGAIYVLLRKYRKNQGKVRWDITPPGI